MAFDWRSLKPFNGSQNNAFEELVCQLAREESIPDKETFTRIGTPDGGVEAYCVLQNGDEYGWQAKYFFSVGTSQWNQITDSFKSAFIKHQNLKKYYICIPIDRPDPRVDNSKWLMDNWNEKVAQWKEYAKAHSRTIEFEFWGSSELIHRLSLEKHAGRKRFWFSIDEFSESWFNRHIQNSINDLGKRYTPKLNVSLSINEAFDALSLNSKHRDNIKEKYNSFLLAINSPLRSIPIDNESVKTDTDNINNALAKIDTQYKISQQKNHSYLDARLVIDSLRSISRSFNHILDHYEENQEKNERTRHIEHWINQAHGSLHDYYEFVSGEIIELHNNPRMLLVGYAGIGKSHTLADIASQQVNANKACILILGQQFSTKEPPWKQILNNLLRINCSESELLGALSAKAESYGERILFIIDAINEGEGLKVWPEYINSFISEFEKFPWISLVISVRSSYKNLLLADTNEKMTHVDHPGFNNIEQDATNIFFTEYEIDHPSIPLLHPEFSNPLFLKLFCEGLHGLGLHTIPKDYSGITKILNIFLDNIDRKLGKSSEFDYSPDLNITRNAVYKIIEYKVNNASTYIPYEQAYHILEEFISRHSTKRRLLDALISEGVFTKNIYWSENNTHTEGIYLTYERFEDHLTTESLINSYLNECPDANNKANCNKFLNSLKDKHLLRQGLLEALAIQLPEYVGVEIFEAAGEAKHDNTFITNSFIQSLPWRTPESIGPVAIQYIDDVILQNKSTAELFLKTSYSIAAIDNHPLNADRLHSHLLKQTLQDRDAYWTAFLYDKHHESPILRLIKWPFNNNSLGHITSKSRLLSAKAISWIFTCTNIQLRDDATLSLVKILENNIHTAIDLLREFHNVNDPYVYERILASVYGAILRSENLHGIENLSWYIIDEIFNQDEVCPNILVRDYARNIVEYALHRNFLHLESANIIRPPYNSTFPKHLPTNEEIDIYDIDATDNSNTEYPWSQKTILSSMTTEYGRGIGGYGDFGRYTFESCISYWECFDPQRISNYACKLIFEKFGYSVDKHGKFDAISTNNINRHDNTIERIGKKYQWLSLYEVVARLSDNFKMLDASSTWSENKQYVWFEGPWQLYRRNLDPTYVEHNTTSTLHHIHDFPIYNDWEEAHKDWLLSYSCLPDIKSLIHPDPSWFFLKRFCEWNEPTPIGHDKYDIPRKNLRYDIFSYFLKSEHAQNLLEWATNKNLFGKNLPDIHNPHQVFALEYYWSPAYKYYQKPYYSGTQQIEDHPSRVIANVTHTTEIYSWESKFRKSPYHLMPANDFFSNMIFTPPINTEEWFDKEGNLACFDATNIIGKSSFMCNKTTLIDYLERSGMSIVWFVLARKQIVGGFGQHDRFSNGIEISGVGTLNNGKLIFTPFPTFKTAP